MYQFEVDQNPRRALLGWPALSLIDEVERLWAFTESIDRLREPDGASVTIFCDNPDPGHHPTCAVEIYDDWTNWQPERFTGETLTEALDAAEKMRRLVREGKVTYGDSVFLEENTDG